MIQATIVEIGPRSSQGATQPFKCQADDGFWYWVKGTKAGPESLCAEWLAARLGQMLGLPIPEFAQVEVSEGLIRDSAIPGIGDLGSGIRFGSRHILGAQEYDVTHIPLTDESLRREVLLFDAWICNTDRTFSRPYGSSGNPNLLWQVPGGKLFVIDHNNAFLDEELFHSTGFNSHVFVSERARLPLELKKEMMGRMQNALQSLPTIMEEIPAEWRCLDNDASIPSGLTADRVASILMAPLKTVDGLQDRLK